MNKKIRNICLILGCTGLFSCSEISFGDEFLGDQPESSGATTEQMFSSKAEADKVLNRAYTGLPYGLPAGGNNALGGNVLEAITDLCQSFRDNINDGPMKLYYNGSLSPNNINGNAAYVYGGETDWTTIRYAWLYIENIDKVSDISAEEKKIRVAEAKTLIALSYYHMMRYVGGVCWLDHSIEVSDAMSFPRITFAETVTKIVDLLDQAIPDLVWKQDEINDGRMTKAGAMALKFKVLQWAASPTLNSNSKWHSAADEYTCYGNEDAGRWKLAKDAGDAFFAELAANQGYELIQPAEETHRARRLAYRKAYYDRGGTEVLISTRKGYGEGTHGEFIGQRYYTGPTLNYVDMFPWEDGKEFDSEGFDWSAPKKQPFFEYKDGKMLPTRDPRLYENVACPGDIYCNGTTAPVYVNNAQYKEGSGFLIMKFILQENADRANRPVQWPYLRLSEIMLDYAEVLTMANGAPTDQAIKLVDDVRARVGLSGYAGKKYTKEEFVDIILNEKALELGFEEVRWFDLVRWGKSGAFTKDLYGLESRGNDLNNPTEFTFKKVMLSNKRYWKSNWDSKWFFAPIPQNEINKKYGMTQNPGW